MTQETFDPQQEEQALAEYTTEVMEQEAQARMWIEIEARPDLRIWWVNDPPEWRRSLNWTLALMADLAAEATALRLLPSKHTFIYSLGRPHGELQITVHPRPCVEDVNECPTVSSIDLGVTITAPHCGTWRSTIENTATDMCSEYLTLPVDARSQLVAEAVNVLRSLTSFEAAMIMRHRGSEMVEET